MQEFNGLDLLGIDDMLEEEARMVRNTVCEWIDDTDLPPDRSSLMTDYWSLGGRVGLATGY